jgi:hypothetical protein
VDGRGELASFQHVKAQNDARHSSRQQLAQHGIVVIPADQLNAWGEQILHWHLPQEEQPLFNIIAIYKPFELIDSFNTKLAIKKNSLVETYDNKHVAL